MAQVLAELRLLNDRSVLRIARAYVRELAALAGLADDDCDALAWAVEAACEDVVEHAFDPGESSPLTIAAELTPSALTIAIRERGLPFDPAQVPSYGAPPAEDAAPPRARAHLWGQIHMAVDKAHWINHGAEGMELRLCKARPREHSPAVPAASGGVPAPHDEPRAPEQTYAVRRLQPWEAIGVSQVVYRAYGHSYPNPDMYYSDRIVQLNETGELVSVVAVDESGTVAGHYALERPGLGPIAEAGQAVVAPAHRERGLMERMHACLLEEGQRLGLRGICVQPVTAHPCSQRVQEEFGGRVCGVSLGVWPALAFKQIGEEVHPRRSTLMLYFNYLRPPEPATVHVPAHHRTMVERIYANLGGSVECRPGRAPRGYGKVSGSYLKTFRLATLAVRQIGIDTTSEIRRAREDLVGTAGAEAVLLELPLAQPGAAALCEAAEADGFFFGGIGPCFAAAGDVLRLQYLAVPVDSGRLEIFSPFGKELLAYVDAECERVGRGRAPSRP